MKIKIENTIHDLKIKHNKVERLGKADHMYVCKLKLNLKEKHFELKSN